MKSKLYLILSLIIITAMLLTATSCRNKQADAEEITLWGSADDQNMLSDMVKSFKNDNTEIKNDIVVKVTGEDVAKDEALKDIDAAADVFAIGHDQLGSLVEAGAVYEITGQYLANIEQNIGDAAIKAATYNNKIYGFPSSAETYLLYYNKSLLSDEDVTSLNKILSKDLGSGVSKFGMNLGEGYYGASFFFTAGCTLFGESGEEADKCDFNNENGLKAASFISRLKSMGGLNCDENEALSQMKQGKLASYVTGPWKADAMKETLGDNYGVVKLPTVALTDADAQAQMNSFAGYKIYVVNAKTKNPSEAMQLAAYLTNEQNQLKRFNDRSLLPVNEKIASNDDVTSDITVAATLDQLQYGVPMPGITQISKFWTAFKAFAVDCYNGNIPQNQMQEKLDNMVNQITAQ